MARARHVDRTDDVRARALLDSFSNVLRLSAAPFLFASSMAVASAACIAEPTFVLDESDGVSTSTSPTAPISGEGDDEMVLIAATSFSGSSTLAPTAPGSDAAKPGEDKGEKGKGKGDAGGGGGGGGSSSSGGSSSGGSSSGGTSSDGGVTTGTNGTTTTVPAFWIDTHEVTARAYAACVDAGRCTKAGEERGCTIVSGFSSDPVNCVSVDQARAFCAWRGKRLVKNDEWTAAAAGAQLRPYPWGSEAPSPARLNACGGDDCGDHYMYSASDGHTQTAPVGSFPAGRSPEGVWDLAGNVAEWVDVAGATITRGGSFADYDVAAVNASSVRPASGPSLTVGFRCARDD